MASMIQVYRLAAAAVGSGTPITDPADNTTIARAITGVWDLCRRAAIREGAWNFAMVRDRLPSLTELPEFGFAYKFKLPTNCLRLIEVRAGGTQLIDYQLEAGHILSDVNGPLDVRCLVDVTEPAEWDDLFAHTFAFHIAWTIGAKIAGSNFDKTTVWQSYQDGLKASRRVDAMENPPLEREESDWIHARHVSAFWDPRP